MIFGFIDDMVSATAKVVEDAIDVSAAVVTMGEYGELNKENVSRLIASGITAYALAEAAGVTVDIIEKVMED